MSEFKPLTFPFTKNGWTHTLLKHEGLLCLVRRHQGKQAEHFEVVRLKEESKRVWQQGLREIESPAHESYPSNEDWGTYGFTFSSNSHRDPLSAAHLKFFKIKGKDNNAN